MQFYYADTQTYSNKTFYVTACTHFPHYWFIAESTCNRVNDVAFCSVFVATINMRLNKRTSCWWFEACDINAIYPEIVTGCAIQYIPRNMHTVFALLCFVVVTHWLIFPYPSGLLHWHCGNLTIAPVPAKQPWWIWINTSCEFIMNDCITTTKQSTTKPCAYFLGYTVHQTRYLLLATCVSVVRYTNISIGLFVVIVWFVRHTNTLLFTQILDW